ncbi:MAG: hypothetical protein JF632_08870 [Acidobacteria bacterium]|nr:hypothetical protein [Acidobacteriota bacterium]
MTEAQARTTANVVLATAAIGANARLVAHSGPAGDHGGARTSPNIGAADGTTYPTGIR